MIPKLLMAMAMLSMMCCSDPKTKLPAMVAPEKKIEFYYYPKTNMYYDVANKQYLYSLDSAKTWIAQQNESGSIPSTLGNKFIIYSNTDSVWKNNRDHRNMYKGRLYHIIKENNHLPSTLKDAREKRPPVKSIKKPIDKQTDSSEAPKKGIRGFFNRLFGKHKKK